MPDNPVVVSFATAWGPKFGGINAFNVEFVMALGMQPERIFDLACVVLKADQSDIDEARKYGVELIALERAGDDYPPVLPTPVLKRLVALAGSRPCILIGHDTKSGEVALRVRDDIADSRAVLIHHMAFGAYADFKKGDSTVAARKREDQREMFRKADLCIAVGPMLAEQLEDLLGGKVKRPPIEQLIPGLADLKKFNTAVEAQPPHNFTAFVSGRLGDEDDRIKQGALSVRAFGAAIRKVFEGPETDHRLRKSPTLRMRGVPPDAQAAVRNACQDESKRVINLDLASYSEDRETYFRDLATSSIALMPSWHEGFGLVGWEAIASGVPLIVGEQSGVFRHLDKACSGAGLGRSVRSVSVAGFSSTDDSEPNHTEADVEQVCGEILSLSGHLSERKRDALQLLENLRRKFGYTWQNCAAEFTRHVGEHLKVSLTRSTSESVPATTDGPSLVPTQSSTIPVFLRRPQRRQWRRDDGLAPSMLLAARDQVVGFHPEREPQVSQLQEWMDTTTWPVSIKLTIGPGGMGKTRLAYELIDRAKAAQWSALWLGESLPADWKNQWQEFLAAKWQPKGPKKNGGSSRVLLVIDYAESRPEVLVSLLEIALELRADRRESGCLRVLALARSDEWWVELPRRVAVSTDVEALISGPAFCGIEKLPPWGTDLSVRKTSFESAIRDYAAVQGLGAPMHRFEPDLSSSVFDRPLFIHMAALAVLNGDRTSEAEGLMDSLLHREWRFWKQTGYAPNTDYEDWADSLAWLSLVQGASGDQLLIALQALGIEGKEIASGLAQAYPGGTRRVAALQPDLLAEALIKSQLSGARGETIAVAALGRDKELCEKALQVVARLGGPQLMGNGLGSVSELVGPVNASLIVGLTQAWEIFSFELISAGHSQGGLLGRLLAVSWGQLPHLSQARLANMVVLPDYSTPLIDLSVAVARAALAVAQGQDENASALNNLANRLSERGDAASREEALGCARESVGIFYWLSSTMPEAFKKKLSVSVAGLRRIATALDVDVDTEIAKSIEGFSLPIGFIR